MKNQVITLEEVQTVISKGKFVFIKNHNENNQITLFKVWNNIITIECGNVRKFKIDALDYFLRNIVVL